MRKGRPVIRYENDSKKIVPHGIKNEGLTAYANQP